MKIVPCQPDEHADAILAIFNDAIVNSTAIYEYQPRTRAMVEAWFETKKKSSFPVLGAENSEGQLMGFASYGVFRTFPGYKYTVEHMVYVDKRFRRQGLASTLVREIIAAAQSQQYHCMVGVIDSANHGQHQTARGTWLRPQRLHHPPCVGFKFGQWLDLVFYQLRSQRLLIRWMGKDVISYRTWRPLSWAFGLRHSFVITCFVIRHFLRFISHWSFSGIRHSSTR